MATRKGYEPQVNVQDGEEKFDDPDQYMMLVRPFAGKKLPYLQMLLPLTAVILTIIGLSLDEISDGDWEFTDESYLKDEFTEVDYDCGWKQLKFNYYWTSGYESNEKFLYSSNLCDEDEDVFDKDWCSTMNTIGKVWLAMNIIALLISFISIPIVYKFGKQSLLYFVINFFSLVIYLIAVGNWFSNEKCTDIEESYGDYDYYELETNVGASMVLTICSAGMILLSLLVSSIHLIQKRNFQRGDGLELPPRAANPAINSADDTAA